MKKIGFLLLILAGIQSFAQENKTQPVATPQPTATSSVQIAHPNMPEMTFTKTEHDFGTVKKGEPIAYKFEFKNTGKEDLIINNCRGGCECTKAKCSKEPIKPGATSFIEVHYDSTRVGKFGKEVMIHSNARKPVTLLVIRGNVEDPNAVQPEPMKQTPAEKKD